MFADCGSSVLTRRRTSPTSAFTRATAVGGCTHGLEPQKYSTHARTRPGRVNTTAHGTKHTRKHTRAPISSSHSGAQRLLHTTQCRAPYKVPQIVQNTARRGKTRIGHGGRVCSATGIQHTETKWPRRKLEAAAVARRRARTMRCGRRRCAPSTTTSWTIYLEVRLRARVRGPPSCASAIERVGFFGFVLARRVPRFPRAFVACRDVFHDVRCLPLCAFMYPERGRAGARRPCVAGT